jgi:hypothetical protein
MAASLAINSTKYFVLFSGDLTGIQWRALHMSTTFAVFVSTGVTLAYSCVRRRNFSLALCLAAIILLMWLGAYHTVNLLESGEFSPPTNLWKNDWVNFQIIWKETAISKLLSRKVLYNDERCICLQHLLCFSPQEWLLPIVVLGLEISPRTNRILRLLGCF